ncbi:MAG: hypothetical protein MUF09_07190 [Candidatus Nanopelagicales bacterium]|jgi:hypothetical protein|nr:hypothetical protein [Candidatus Nanopelagicales bacterium]
MSKTPKVVAILLYIAGAVLLIGGAGTWYTVSDQLAAERITVSDDAPCQAGQEVNGPLEAYCMAEIINTHALEATGGKTYAELDREDPLRAVAQSSSFLRASLFTSVVAFGVAAFAMGVGVLSILIGVGIGALDTRTRAADLPAEMVAA